MNEYYIAKRKHDKDWGVVEFIKEGTFCPAYFFTGYEVPYKEIELDIFMKIDVEQLINKNTSTNIDFKYRYLAEKRYDILQRCMEVLKTNLSYRGHTIQNFESKFAKILQELLDHPIDKSLMNKRVSINYLNGELSWKIIEPLLGEYKG